MIKLNNILSLVLIGMSVSFISCSDSKRNPGYEYMPDMYRSPSYEANSENGNFANNASNLTPVEGTIPRGFTPYAYENNNEGYEAAGAELKNPLKPSKENLAHGKQLYSDFCSHCHGDKGDGQGKLVQRKLFPAPPDFKGRLIDLPDGKMYHSITYGRNLMGSHASQVEPEERWKIVLYINQLQTSK